MTLNKNIFPWFNALLLVLTLELSSYNYRWLYALVPMTLAVIVLSLWEFNGRHFGKDWLRLSISPLLFPIGAILFFIFLVPRVPFFLHGYVAIVALLTVLYYKNIHDIADGPQIYRPYALENPASHFNLISIFLLCSSFYNFVFFSTAIFWLVEALLALIVIGLLYQSFWANRVLNKRNALFIFVAALIMAEAFLAVSFMPLGFYVSGLILTLIYYFLAEATRAHLLDRAAKRNFRRELIIVAVVLLVVLLTARWS